MLIYNLPTRDLRVGDIVSQGFYTRDGHVAAIGVRRILITSIEPAQHPSIAETAAVELTGEYIPQPKPEGKRIRRFKAVAGNYQVWRQVERGTSVAAVAA